MAATSIQQTAGRFRLKTPTLRFTQVEADRSLVLPLVIEGAPDHLLQLEVVVPPFAPFSITAPPASYARRKDDQNGACLWLRYDPRSGTSFDEGEVTVRVAESEREWTVPLVGCGHLVRDF